MASHVRRLLSKKESLWVKWIHSYRLCGRSFWDAPKKYGSGFAWRNILDMRDKIREYIVSQIGDGCSTSAWFDNWHPAGPLSNFLSVRDIHDAGFTPDTKVADLVLNGYWTVLRLMIKSKSGTLIPISFVRSAGTVRIPFPISSLNALSLLWFGMTSIMS
ncbi:hypothetical protein L2E82_44787 [Cichorium intybus]|uniref:Uncharacterized protein n=1 Tax=Cichorium intybus TaxID=13427 RepID=A0ACB8ZS62_CICIN|nr:hypothetical protein L2E82_44787 [Cichorium intybus]